jgi:site-specific DNA-methyltransferase (adenine-specific)
VTRKENIADGIEIYLGDCREILPTLGAGSIDAVIADLPYGTTSNKWDSVIEIPFLWTEYQRITAPVSAIVLTASQPFTSQLVTSGIDLFKHEWIWIKNAGSNFANTVREPMKEHESVLVFAKGKWTYNRQMQERTGGGAERVKTPVKFDTGSDNYRQFDRIETKMMPELRVPSSWQKFNRERGLHPTQKPLGLMEYMVRTYTNPDDTVLDNAMGSGTTGVAAALLGRRFVGIEVEEKYFDIACRRVEEASRKAIPDQSSLALASQLSRTGE